MSLTSSFLSRRRDDVADIFAESPSRSSFTINDGDDLLVYPWFPLATDDGSSLSRNILFTTSISSAENPFNFCKSVLAFLSSGCFSCRAVVDVVSSSSDECRLC